MSKNRNQTRKSESENSAESDKETGIRISSVVPKRPIAPLYRFDGALGYNSTVTLAAITDGTSNTALIGERYRYLDQYDQWTTSDGSTGRYGTWGMGTPDINNACQEAVGSIGMRFNWNRTESLTDGTNLSIAAGCFSSRHTNGVNFVFCDGSVHFLTESVSDATRLALGTIAGGEVVDLP